MPWKTMDVKEQRVQFVVAASRREQSMSCVVQGVRYLPDGGLRLAEALPAGRRERDRRAQPTSSA